MNLSILFITIFIFLNNISYAVYEIKNKNKLGGITVILFSTFMIIFVNYAMLSFK